MRRALLGFLLLAAAPDASAFPSAAGGQGLHDVRSADVPSSGDISIQVGAALYRADETNGLGARKVDLADGGIQLGVGAAGFAEIWGSFGAAVLDIDAESYRAIAPRDSRIGGKIRFGSGRWMPGLALETSLPTGKRPRGFSTDSFDPAVTALLTVALPESNTLTGARLHANVGWRGHGDDRGRGFEGWPLYFLEPVHPADDRNRIDIRTAIELAGRRTTLFAELLLDQLQSDGVAFSESPLFLTPGLRYAFSESFSFMAASKITLASDDESTNRFKAPEDLYPNWQVGLALTWSRRGPSSDRDGDGVPDFQDQCPREAEDRDGWEDADGCPDRDDDGDGIRDEFDASPRAREDFDGWLDSDGAPDPDNDADGLADGEDRCPGEAEDKDGIADADGCPEDDADSDGVPDIRDKCPEEAENLDGVEDADGCPERTSSAPRGLPSVEWEGAAVAPKPASFYDLNQLAERMRRDPGLHVEIRVRPAPSEGAAARADLARLRAEYLKAFLVATGIDPTRVMATGLPARSSREGGTGTRPEVEVVENEPRARD